MPLLDLIGVDSCQRSFCVAFAFLSGECEEDYFWALDRLQSVGDHKCEATKAVARCGRRRNILQEIVHVHKQ
ncbi:Uncharacterized protein HZ326_25909 [Fusarium oxysporum f. sp. albedinis]|nr:Uncharacterized protein HZ326_25909 [Fusarium oxysporum f. sp. albedinis]